MLRRQLAVLLGFLVIGGLFLYGVSQLFALRLAKGDSYPPYSTLRADPLGAEALLDSLNEVPGVTATRNYRPLVRLKPDGPVTLVYLGVDKDQNEAWKEDELARLQTLIVTGSRAVFAFAPLAAVDPDVLKRREERKKQDELEKKKAAEKEHGKLPDESGKALSPMAVAEKWGVKFELTQRGKGTPLPKFTAEGEGEARAFESALPWHSELHFKEVSPAWKTLYSLRGQPVLIERTWGSGSIVMAADSYFLSNEGLRDDQRAPKLIVHLVGPHPTVVFDEEHLGTVEQSGVATLARKFRLHGLVVGLVLVALLFIWQNMVRFVPPQPEEERLDALVAGRGSDEGFLVLLRRSVPLKQLLATCVQEFRRTFTGDPRLLARLDQAFDPAAAPRKAPEAVATYAALAKANSKSVSSRADERPSALTH